MKLKFSIFLILIFTHFLTDNLIAQTKKPTIERLLTTADSLLQKKEFEQAKKNFQDVLKTDEHSVRAHLGLGKIAIHEKKWNAAKDHFGKILEHDPDNLQAVYFRAICFRETGKFKALLLRKLDWDKSKKLFLQVIARDSLFNDVFYQYARLMRYRGKYKKAIQLCHTQIRLRPELIEPQVRIFRFYKYFIAHTDEKKSIFWLQQQPWAQARYAMGEKLRRSGKLNQADSVFQSLLKQPVEMSKQPIYLSLARIYYEHNKPNRAQYYFWRAVDTIKNNVDAALVFNDVKYILTDGELAHYRSLISLKEKIDFFHTLWTQRDPTPASEINVRLAEHYRRLLYAEKYYEFDGFRTWFNNPDKLGYLNFTNTYNLNDEFNDKGLIYIRHGKPDEWARTIGENIPPNESWLYYGTQNNPKMIFHFVLENTPGYWRFTPIIMHPQILEDRLGWDGIYYRLLWANHLERTMYAEEMASASRKAVTNGLSSDRHTWQKKFKPWGVPFSSATFRGEKGKTILEIYYMISLDALTADMEADRKTINIETGISLHDRSWHLVKTRRNNQKLPLDSAAYYIDFYRFEVQPDTYNVSFYARPETTDFLGGWKFKKYVDDYSSSELSMSEIEMASLIAPAERADKFEKHQLIVIPNPSRTYSLKKPMYIYFEIYNLTKNSNGQTDFLIEYTLTHLKGEQRKLNNLFGLLGRGGKSSITTMTEREGRSAFSVEYLAIDVSRLKKGEHELKIKVTDKNSAVTTVRTEKLNLL